jgi:uncharacterized metal-binding protein YceD (DUF177 family)
MKIAPEFSRPVRVDALPATPRPIEAGANEAERAALAKRFGLLDIEKLSAEALLSRRGEDVVAEGSLTALVTQSCVATGQPVPARVEETFSIVFRPHPDRVTPDEEIELSEGELDVVFFDGASIDFGEAVAETLSLSLDPYPRAPEAETALREAGVKGEDEVVEPAGPLAGLKDLIEGKKP